MNVRSRRVSVPRGFSLLELLFTVAIIAVLAALMLPVLQSAQRKAQRTRCANNLKQIGTALHAWAHDHQDKFPMEVPMVERGTLEFAQPGASMVAYKHFQAISNELVETRLLVCPSERMRVAAGTFSALQNSNLSYLVNVRAAFGKSDSVLAADRNIRTSGRMEPTYLQFGAGDMVEWSSALHAGSGNVLFGDSHVDSVVSAAAAHQLTNAGEVVAALPETDALSAGVVASPVAADGIATTTPAPTPTTTDSSSAGEVAPSRSAPASGSTAAVNASAASEASRSNNETANAPGPSKHATNPASVPVIVPPSPQVVPTESAIMSRASREGQAARPATAGEPGLDLARSEPLLLRTTPPPRQVRSNHVAAASAVAEVDDESDAIQFARWLGKAGTRFTYSLLLLLLAVLVLVEVLRRRKKKKRTG